ncbi:MAG: hypothetical protein B6I25_00260 [Planctomycetales bacterium 4572_13]|nr:MAG: hypothetical protein B6I25_00260 [Planctomycetales bacterium 4572_13]
MPPLHGQAQLDHATLIEQSVFIVSPNYPAHPSRMRGYPMSLRRCRAGLRSYAGNQWSADDLAKLQREGRPALTINLLSGIQRQGRQDVSVVARKGGLKPLAAVFTQVLRHCLDITEADYELADMFTDGIIGGKGWLKMSIDYYRGELGRECDKKMKKVVWHRVSHPCACASGYCSEAGTLRLHCAGGMPAFGSEKW